MDRAYRASTRLIGLITFALGLTMVVVTLAQGGGPLAVGVIGGVLFTVVGALRFVHAGRGAR